MSSHHHFLHSILTDYCECKNEFIITSCILSLRITANARIFSRMLTSAHHSCIQMNPKGYKKARECKHSGLLISFWIRSNPYLFENCGARLAALRPGFFLSFILGSLVKNPAFLRAGRYSASACKRALEIPCLIAPA